MLSSLLFPSSTFCYNNDYYCTDELIKPVKKLAKKCHPCDQCDFVTGKKSLLTKHISSNHKTQEYTFIYYLPGSHGVAPTWNCTHEI